jgi:DNA-binding MarR family transcriptional regulator
MENLCKIRDIQRSVKEFEQTFEKRFDICLNEGMVLCSLTNKEKLSSGEIGESLGISFSNASKVIASAEKKGLIKRFLCKEDKRQMLFSITEKGQRLMKSIDCEELELPDLLRQTIK